MKKLFTILVATMMLAACQTTSAQVSSKQPPRVVTDKPIAATRPNGHIAAYWAILRNKC
ncbi:hypothetical protein PsAD14_01260 [Pseudovibrio sp. Ad14]|nr:hypothetical protein PsW74_03866 [Pseudovibrio sp. W74]KZL10353.1 hypothetical protein PsAD14_01260 [Pseudovibrio sp. Ad14]